MFKCVKAFLLTAAIGIQLVPGPSPAAGKSLDPLPHNVHVTRGRMVVENGLAVAQIRFFRHDLEDAVAAFHHVPSFELENTAWSDSLFLSYFNDRFSLLVEGKALSPIIAASGEKKDVWWFDLEFRHSRTIDSVTVHNELLFELFSDQKHFLKLSFFPSSETRLLYFVDGATTYSVRRDDL